VRGTVSANNSIFMRPRDSPEAVGLAMARDNVGHESVTKIKE
jgi:hypothetical protein